MKNLCLILFIIVTGPLQIFAQKSFIQSLKTPNQWVENKLKKMSKRERIAQMFFIRGLSNSNAVYNDSLVKFVKSQNIGGVIFFQGSPVRQAQLTNELQKNTKIPLLIAMDAEWGLGMRIDSTVSYPYQMALGAIQDNSLIVQMGKAVAEDFKIMGMHLNFAPDVDINNNPKNPVINYRSFGENKDNVFQKGLAYMNGMQSQNILTALKHFPGHGDTDVDSHLGLPVIPHSKERLMNLEIYPFLELIKKNASGVMVAHLNIPNLDATPNIPSTLSKPIITDLLKKTFKFGGLVITDAMEMKAMTKLFKPGEADLKAIQAGNDIIELSEDVHLGIKTVLKKVRTDKMLMQQIDQSVRKILMAKYWTKDTTYTAINTTSLISKLNQNSKKQLQAQLAEAAITLIKGKESMQKLRFENKTVAINISPSGNINIFQKKLPTSYNAQLLSLKSSETDAMVLSTLYDNLKNFKQIILSITDERSRPAIQLPLSNDVKNLITKICALPDTHLILFANPYCLDELNGAEKASSICIAYQKEDFMQNAAAKVYNKKLNPTGRLPVTINNNFKSGLGSN